MTWKRLLINVTASLAYGCFSFYFAEWFRAEHLPLNAIHGVLGFFAMYFAMDYGLSSIKKDDPKE